MPERPTPDEIVADLGEGWRSGSFLAGLDPQVRANLLAAGELVSFPAGSRLIVEGWNDDDTFLILRSFAKVTASLSEGGEALLTVRVGGDIVGEMAALDGSPRSATVTACGRVPLSAVRIGAGHFREIVARDGASSLRLGASISAKLRAANRSRVDYTSLPPVQRMAKSLLELADACGRNTGTGGVIIQASLTQIELGTLIGVKRATAERAVARLRSRGLIDAAGRLPIVRDLAELRRFAEQPRMPSDEGLVD
jgi:CRP/FNR family transcriptional regulator, cyclic AMP receptor protein